MVLLDIKEGILRKFYKYIVIIVITLLIAVMYIYTYNNLVLEGKIDNTGFTIADIWIYCFRGKLIQVSNGISELPSAVYLLFQLIIAFVIGDYARKDYDSRARYIIIRTKSRISWITGKMVWAWCALSIQLMVSFIINSEVGYMMIVVVIILSAYIRNALCIGNAFMYVNISYISGGIINPLHIIAVSCLVCMISNIILIKKFRRIDIF